MQLSRDAIQRMTESGVGGGSSFDPSVLGGLANQSWVENSYVSKAFFNTLFTVNGTEKVETSSNGGSTWKPVSTTDIVLAPNEIPSQVEVEDETTHVITRTTRSITNIEIKTGAWTNSFLSALGLNSAGGGGGGTSLNALLDNINSSNIGNIAPTPSNIGKCLVYNGSNQWTWATPGGGGGGTLTSIGLSMPTGFQVAESPLTADGTFIVTFATGYSLPTTENVNKGVTAYGWGNHANAGYLTTSAMSNYSFWGQSPANGVVSGSMTGVGSITSNTAGSLINFNAVEFAATGTSESGNGGALYFHFPGVSGYASSYILEEEEGVIALHGKLKIGSAVIEWDSTNQCLKINGGVYATSFVSALGLSSN